MSWWRWWVDWYFVSGIHKVMTVLFLVVFVVIRLDLTWWLLSLYYQGIFLFSNEFVFSWIRGLFSTGVIFFFYWCAERTRSDRRENCWQWGHGTFLGLQRHILGSSGKTGVGELSRHHVEPQPAAETDLPLWVNQQQLLCSLHPPNYQDQNPCDKATRDFDFSVRSLATLPFLKVEVVGLWMVYGRR